MTPKNIITFSFETKIRIPFEAEIIDFNIVMHPECFKQSPLAQLTSIQIYSLNCQECKSDWMKDIIIKTVYKFNVKPDSPIFKEIVRGKKYLFDEGRFSTLPITNEQLIYDILTYGAWKKGLYIGKTYTLSSTWKWTMNPYYGDSQSDEPIITFDSYWALVPIEPISFLIDDFKDFWQLQEDDRAVPLHHELLSEVMVSKNYGRSAYLILYTAFEVATKTLLKFKRPELAWFVENIPSPDLLKIYREFIDIHIAKIVDEEGYDKLRNINNKRNGIAHTGKPVKHETLVEDYELIRAWIKKIDCELGYF